METWLFSFLGSEVCFISNFVNILVFFCFFFKLVRWKQSDNKQHFMWKENLLSTILTDKCKWLYPIQFSTKGSPKCTSTCKGSTKLKKVEKHYCTQPLILKVQYLVTIQRCHWPELPVEREGSQDAGREPRWIRYPLDFIWHPTFLTRPLVSARNIYGVTKMADGRDVSLNKCWTQGFFPPSLPSLYEFHKAGCVIWFSI